MTPLRKFLPLTLLPALSGCHLALLDPQGTVGASEKTILLNATSIMLVIVVPTVLATLVFAWWFRASNTRAQYLPEWSFSGRLELVVWSIPFLTIMFLGGVSWIGSHRLDPAAPLSESDKPLEVQVVALDWKWLFIYPAQGIAAINQLVIPAGKPVHFALTSASVMNVFFVPQLGSMIYAMNGMSTQLNLAADQPGEFRGEAAHFSGNGFPDMHFTVRAVTAQEFADWSESARAGPALGEETYKALAQQSLNVTPITYGTVDPYLYRKIVTQVLPPGPGPETDAEHARAR